MARTIVGGVGYTNLRDHSVGVAVVERLQGRLRADVAVEDLSYNPIAVMQRLEDEPPDRRFTRAILVTGVARGRPPGSVTCYRWDRALPSEDAIQLAVTEAITGIISIDNTLVVAGHFAAWPDDVLVVEIEPAVHEFGETLSPPVAAVFERVCDLIARLATDDRASADLPCVPLGGCLSASVSGR